MKVFITYADDNFKKQKEKAMDYTKKKVILINIFLFLLKI